MISNSLLVHIVSCT